MHQGCWMSRFHQGRDWIRLPWTGWLWCIAIMQQGLAIGVQVIPKPLQQDQLPHEVVVRLGGHQKVLGSLRRYMSLCIHCIHAQMYILFVLSLIFMFCIFTNDFGRLSDIIQPIMIVGWGIPSLPAAILCDWSLPQSHWISWISCGDFL